MVNDVIKVPRSSGTTIRYGSFTWNRDTSNAHLAGGLAIYTGNRGWAGAHNINKFVVFTNVGMNDALGTAISIEEVVESYAGSDNICGTSSNVSFFEPGKFDKFSPKGINIVRFIAAFPR